MSAAMGSCDTHHVKLQAVVFLHQAQHKHAETCSKTRDMLCDSTWSTRFPEHHAPQNTSFLYHVQAHFSRHSALPLLLNSKHFR